MLIPFRRRTPDEARAYVDGFEVGAREALRYAERASVAEAADHIESLVHPMRATLDD